MPPLTPGTNKKLTEVLKQSFASWEKELQNCNITKGNYYQLLYLTYFILFVNIKKNYYNFICLLFKCNYI